MKILDTIRSWIRPPAPVVENDLVRDGFESTDDDPPTRAQLVEAGILAAVATPERPAERDEPDPPLEGSLEARRAARRW